ncbi:MAG: sporulation protein YabP [Oscillospiraceae bacterium]|nr:sporulation protein YabP [Oscillospiraceae bacterium]
MDRTEMPENPQKLTLENRRKLSVSGVQDVESFEENAVVLHTNRGVLVIRGQDLHLRQLSVEGGQVVVEGNVEALLYEESRKEGGFLARLFG